MSKQIIVVPDIGGAEEVEVIEISVAPGATVKQEDALIVLESDKASMEVPSPYAGKVIDIQLKVGDKVSAGKTILTLEVADEKAAPAKPEKAAAEKPAAAAKSSAVEPVSTKKAAAPQPSAAPTESSIETIVVPDIGGADNVDVIEVNIKVGSVLSEGDTMIVLESDKASMEVPAPKAGIVRAVKIKEGDKVGIGAAILDLEVAAVSTAKAPQAPVAASAAPTVSAAVTVDETAPAAAANTAATPKSDTRKADGEVYAGPAVRKLAREMGIGLSNIPGSGPKGRVQKEDIKNFVRQLMENRGSNAAGSAIPPLPDIDFTQFGAIDIQPLSKLHKITALNMHRSWVNLPHVTQFDDADITELETFRESLKAEAERRGIKVSPLPFLIKACAIALKAHPKFNASLLNDGERIAFKKYVHIGLAVDTPNGLVVPVLRDVDRKSVWELATESAELAQKAKDRKLKPSDMQGGCFTISSLGSIGGTGFTPIINAPEVAILGVSKLAVKPMWNGKEFAPRKMLPLSLSYDHRAVNGADAGRFFTYLNELLADIRRLVL
ncbi:MAG TPA: dihydrolipoyllysine-residue acetyltransferase [Spongiibacteraceae bacterium]|nr:dihydrolipoyllysine-residue acetyltransferase [Spongiibacteraceae bacterium]